MTLCMAMLRLGDPDRQFPRGAAGAEATLQCDGKIASSPCRRSFAIPTQEPEAQPISRLRLAIARLACGSRWW